MVVVEAEGNTRSAQVGLYYIRKERRNPMNLSGLISMEELVA